MTTFIIATTFIPEESRIWAVVLYCFSTVGYESIPVTGAPVNIYDLSPKYAGVITGISHSISQGISAFAPSLVDWVCTDLVGKLIFAASDSLTYISWSQTDAAQWRTVFIIATIFALSTGIFFAIFGSGQKQNWGTESESDAQIEAVMKRKGSVFSISSIAIWNC